MVTIKQIQDEIARIWDPNDDFSKEDSEIYHQWRDMAENWTLESDFLDEGFKGFDERTVNNIIMDFYCNEKLAEQLTEEQIIEYSKP